MKITVVVADIAIDVVTDIVANTADDETSGVFNMDKEYDAGIATGTDAFTD